MALALLAVACAMLPLRAAAQATAPLTRQDVKAAAAKVAADPDLGKQETSRHLRFKDKDSKPDSKRPDDNSAEWLVKFIGRVVEVARWLVWALGALAVAFIVVGLRRWMRVRAERTLAPRGHLPSHVQSLDIRPESLPADVGAAAAALWSRGDHLAALSLLYRGALSRLVHGHGVPIRAASTEGDCMRLADGMLPPAPALFFSRLVVAWQLAVYGGRLPQHGEVLALCSAFAGELGVAHRVQSVQTTQPVQPARRGS